MTLIEMLVAMTITLILIFAMVQLFQTMGEGMSVGRAALERDGQLRNALDRLRMDLDMITVPTRPPVDATAGLGYLEIIEGTVKDRSLIGVAGAEDILGDYDDMIMFTATSRGQPFIGRYQGTQIESYDAEIIWWTVLRDFDGDNTRDPGEYYTLYRRVLLVLPALNNLSTGNMGINLANEAALTTFQQQNDVSVRIESGSAVANSLADLSLRCNRFAHVQGQTLAAYPNLINVNANQNRLLPLAGARIGDDVMLTDVLAFDIRLFDPSAPVRSSGANGVVLNPTDPGWSTGNALGLGAYVDLNYTATNLSQFSNRPYDGAAGRPLTTSCFTDGRASAVYDTWTSFYERDGINQDGDALLDEGANGLDDDGFFGFDTASELEAPPPYPHPLRGVQVIVRITDVPTRQVSQSSISADLSTD